MMLNDFKENIDSVNNFSENQRDYIFNEYFPYLLTRILKQPPIESECLLKNINKFLCYWISRRIPHLCEMMIGDSKILPKIFKAGKYYTCEKIKCLTIGVLTADMKEITGGQSHYENYTEYDSNSKNIAIAFNIDIFGQFQGFAQIVDAIDNLKSLSGKISIIRRFLKTVMNMDATLNKSTGLMAKANVTKSVMRYIKRLYESGECEISNENEIRKLFKYICNFVTSSRFSVEMQKDATNSIREMGLKLFTSDTLDKSMLGVNIICEELNRINNKWPDHNNSSDEAKTFMILLKSKKFFKYLYSHLNAEYISRTAQIIEIAYAWKVIHLKKIIKFLKHSLDISNKALMKSISEITKSVILRCEQSDLIELAKEIEKIPLSKYNEEIISIYSSIIATSNDSSNGYKLCRISNSNKIFLENNTTIPKEIHNGWISFLWELTQSTSIQKGFSEDLQETVINAFTKTISNDNATVENYLKNCEMKIVSNIEFVPCSKVYMKLIELTSRHSHKSNISVNEFPKQIIYSMLDLKLSILSNGLCDRYYTELSQRFKYLAFLIIKMEQPIDGEKIMTLCKGFVINLVNSKEIDIYFGFVQEIISSDIGRSLIKGKVFDELLFDYFLVHQPSDYAESEFDCFVRLIMSMNSIFDTVEIDPPNEYQRKEFKVIGIKYIWRLFYEGKSQKIRIRCREIINSLYNNLQSTLNIATKKQIIDEFLSWTIEYILTENISLGEAKNYSEDSKKKILLALDLFYLCLKNAKEGSYSKTFSLFFQYDSGITRSLEVKANAQLSEVLSTGVALLGLQASNISSLKYIYQGKELYLTNETLSANGITSTSTIEVQSQESLLLDNRCNINSESSIEVKNLESMFPQLPKEQIRNALKKADNDMTQAVQYLTNPEIQQSLQMDPPLPKPNEDFSIKTVLIENYTQFLSFYKLLDIDMKEIGEKVLNILSMIPINYKFECILDTIARLGRSERILSRISVNKAIYIIRVIESSLSEKGDALQQIVNNNGIGIIIKCLNEAFNLSQMNDSKLMCILICAVKHFGDIALKFTAPDLYETYISLHGETAENINLEENTRKEFAWRIATSSIFNALAMILMKSKSSTIISESSMIIHLIPLINIEVLKASINETIYKKVLDTMLSDKVDNSLKNIFLKEIEIMIKILDMETIDQIWLKKFYLEYFLDILMSGNKSLNDSTSYFNIVENLLELYNCKKNNLEFNYSGMSIANNLIPRIMETSGSEANGYLTILCKSIYLTGVFDDINPDIKENLFNWCCIEVFGVSQNNEVTKRKEVNLKPVFSILEKFNMNIREKQETIFRLIKEFNEQQLNISKAEMPSLNQNYVGLINLGCTCYMNAVFQQLFMMTHFRLKILKLSDEKIKDKVTDDNVLYNLKHMFTSLSNDYKGAYSARKFCDDFKGFDSRPIATYQQQDADEFFNHLLEKTELELTKFGEEQFLNEELEIKLNCEITSMESEYPYESNSVERYLSLPLIIKGCKKIEDGLDTFLTGDVLDGDNKYYCNKYKKNIKANKRNYIEELSKTVVITLKRFEYDRHTLNRKKLNDYCEFPNEIDLYKWTKNGHLGKPKENPFDFLYTLAGVLIHSGSAEVGHYYSFIKERNEESPNYGKWFEFNDDKVTPFEISTIGERAFGGSVNGSTASAYLLFYEKSNPIEPRQEAPSSSEIVQVDTATNNKIVFIILHIVHFQRLWYIH